ncbi:hypothetical protein AVEN_106719-1 [Araneus ventricosus]|uniref:Uncharacterized protein n=1 Tax=Araneus ventricosus TaxID=182803 RepID=A0A4Y2EYX6_ARAVE|nr:hypothetical protein AVEN_106719-1 [Araneus ventricosus]
MDICRNWHEDQILPPAQQDHDIILDQPAYTFKKKYVKFPLFMWFYPPNVPSIHTLDIIQKGPELFGLITFNSLGTVDKLPLTVERSHFL